MAGGRYGLEVRRADAGDAAGLAELLSACGVAADARLTAPRLEAIVQAGGVVTVALEWGPPSGVSVLFVEPSLTGAPMARLSLLLVEPDARRRGIGRVLLKAASQAARQGGCEAVRLGVAPQDDAARAFCLATGFTEAGADFTRPLRKRS